MTSTRGRSRPGWSPKPMVRSALKSEGCKRLAIRNPQARSLARQTEPFPQHVQARITAEKCKFWRDKLPADPGRTHEDHLIQRLECPVLIAERCENKNLVPRPWCYGGNSLRILATAGARISHTEGLGAHFQQLVFPMSLQNLKRVIRLSLT